MTDALIVILRYILAALFAALVSRGWIKPDAVSSLSDATLTILVGSAGWLITVGWALYRSRKAAKIADVAAMKDVSTIHVTPALAASTKIENVVATPPATP